MEITGFAKYIVTGDGAAAWLDRLLACRLPAPGRMTLAPMLKHDGRVYGDFTLANPGDGRWLITGSGIAESLHLRWFEQHLPDDRSVSIDTPGGHLCGLAIAGPRSRELLQAVCDADVSADAFRFMAVSNMHIGMAPVTVGRISYTGDLGYEIWMSSDDLLHVYDQLMTAGAAVDLRLFGLRALNALRLEKNFGSWGREYRPVHDPYECELHRFIAEDKPTDFIGRHALAGHRAATDRYRLRSFIVDADDADVIGDEPIFFEGSVRGWVTSGGYAHGADVSVAMGYVPMRIADTDGRWEIELLGQRLPARRQSRALFDADGTRLRE